MKQIKQKIIQIEVPKKHLLNQSWFHWEQLIISMIKFRNLLAELNKDYLHSHSSNFKSHNELYTVQRIFFLLLKEKEIKYHYCITSVLRS